MTTPQRVQRRQRLLILIQGITAIAATVALVISLETQGQEAIRGRLDGCRLLHRIVVIATPPNKKAEAAKFVARTPLNNCERYARHP